MSETVWATPNSFFVAINKQFNLEGLLAQPEGWLNQDWSYLANILSRTDIGGWIIENAKLLPTKHIGQYMYRYLLCDNKDSSSARINHIMRADLDPFLHDHPFDWRTIILKGWYVEEDVFGNFHRRDAGYTAENKAETFYRIHEVSPGGVWTLFITGPRYMRGVERNHWGFITDGRAPRKVPHEVYHSVNGRGE